MTVFFRPFSALVAGTLLSGCTVSTQQITLDEQRQLITQDRSRMFVTAPITAPITLEEALDRALTYNLDNRLMEMEQALRNNQFNLSRYDLLPQIALNSGYVNRNKENLSLSRDDSTGKLTTNPFLSQDRELSNVTLGLTWNILDFGLSYLQARQNADQLLIATERRRRVVNQIVQGVRSAYWRAATAEPMYKQIVPILVEARQALKAAREAETLRIVPLLDSLQYQKELVEVIRELDVLELDLAIAKTEMASLMGLPPGTNFTLVLPAEELMTVPTIELSIEEMEQQALENRPELREERYQKRISAVETRKALLAMFPSLNFSTTSYTDSNSYLVNQSWADTAMRLSWDLLNIARYPASRKASKSAEELADARRLSLSMAALTQVQISHQQFIRATRDYDQALLLDDIEKRIFNNINEGANNQGQSPLERIRAQLSAVYADVNRFTAYSEVHSALANLYVSMGMDLTPELLPSGISSKVPDGAAAAASSTAVASIPVVELAVSTVAAIAAPTTGSAALAQTFVLDWLAAWQARDVTSYFAHYDTNFQPSGGATLGDWRAARERNIARYSNIVVALQDFEVIADDGNEVVVELLVHFTSPGYEDFTRKQVRLRRNGDDFTILVERNLIIDVVSG
jgi:outer membrane protein TolC